MCELFAMSGRESATVNFSLGVLAEHGGKSGPHADGWGIAFYDEYDVRLLRDTVCASHSPWVEFVAQHEIRSRLVISHIRLATDGAIAIKNTQPFSRELGGRMHVFAHNGHVPEIRQLDQYRATSFQPIGDTDSEIAFCALLERIKPLLDTSGEAPTLAARLEVVAKFALELGEIGLANFLYCDGEVIFAHGHRRKQADGEFRAPGLFLLRRQCSETDPFAESAGVAITNVEQELVLVASVPLTDEAWRPFAEREVVAIAGGRVVETGGEGGEKCLSE